MVLEKEEKAEIIKEFGRHEKDVGSTQVQIAILTRRIEEVSKHLRSAPKDLHSMRGLVKMVGKRRRLLRYLKKEDPEAYNELLSRLNLRK